MTPKPQRAKEIFLELVGAVPSGEWDRRLDEACGGDPQLRERVSALLRAHIEPGSFLEQPAVAVAGQLPTIDQPAIEQAGTMIGSYKLIEEIGEGGMGSVFMALQKEPVRRKVALKVIKPGMDSKQVVSRFEAERQALAMMDHPCIARVFDGGSTESGRPFFVMELVNGMPVTDYCDHYRFTTEQRLELFGQVCRAVQHAHQKGIIHRDLKPSNILVTHVDGRAVPKVIDFGIAKAISGQLIDETMVTHFAQMIGTPLYMSPEQAELSSPDIDTRSDVYSLGVLLYELLTGTTPFDRERMKEVSYDEFRRIIREEEPPRPSTRLSTLDAALDTVADKHQTDPHKLSRQLSGELDWIVMKALEKDRTRRYESANELAKDVQRYLDDETVEACPPSTVYRLKKLARRNKAALTTVSVVLLTMAVGLAGTTWEAIRATEAEGLAGQRLTEVDEQRRRAETNYTKAREAVQQMLTRVADEELAKIPEMKEVRKQLLEDAAAFYTELLKLNPHDPQAYRERGRVYYLLQQYEKVRADYEKAVELDPDKAEFHADLAWFLSRCPDVAHRDLNVALLHGKWAVRLAPRKFQYHGWLADIYRKLGKRDEAMAEGQELVALNPGSADAYDVLRAIRLYTGDLQGALECARKEVELAPDDHWHHTNLAAVYSALGEYENAIAAVTKAIAVANKTRSESSDDGRFHQHVMRADAYIGLKMYEEALADYDKGVELGPFRSYTYKRRAVVHFHLKNYDQALADIAKAVELLPGDTSNLTWIPPAEVAKCPDESFRRGILDVADKAIELNSDAAWAYSLHAQRGLLFAAFGQEDKALADLKAAVEGIPKADESDEQRFSPCYELGSLCVGLAHREETLPYLVRMVDLQPKQPTARYRCALAQLRVSQGAAYNATCRAAVEQFRQTSDAEAAFWTAWTCSLAPNAVDDFSASVALAERAVKNDSKSVGYLSTLGAILHRAGKHEEAIRRLEEADRLIRHPNSESSHSPAYTWFFLAMAHEAAGRHDEAKKWFDKAAAWTNTALREDDEGVKPLAWNRRFTLKLLRDEAEELLKTPVGKQEPPRPPAGKETTKNQ